MLRYVSLAVQQKSGDLNMAVQPLFWSLILTLTDFCTLPRSFVVVLLLLFLLIVVYTTFKVITPSGSHSSPFQVAGGLNVVILLHAANSEICPFRLFSISEDQMKVLSRLLVQVTFSPVIDVHVGLKTAGEKKPKTPFRQNGMLLD